MRTEIHRLVCASLGTERSLMSLHFGAPGSQGKAYLQASLHADELPGMLVIHMLRGLLVQAEAAGHIRGEIVLVPVANPIGLAQSILYQGVGRFELDTAQNFNRGFPNLLALLGDDIEDALGSDAHANRDLIRERMRQGLDALKPRTQVESLRLVLTRLACDADIVLDLHCDEESILHLYTETPYWPQAEPLARYLGTRANLISLGQGSQSFDEALSGVWWQLDSKIRQRHPGGPPVPLACLAATIEHRGQADVDPDFAASDARALFAFLQHRGLIAGEAPPLPPLVAAPTPLAGAEEIRAEHAGILYFLKQPGDWIDAGAEVARIVDPLANTTTTVHATVSGLLYGRLQERYAAPGRVICRIAGAIPFRTGPLLSP